MAKLKMLTKGPNGNYRKGQIVEVDALRASILVSGGDAEEVIDDRNTADPEELQAVPRTV